MSSLSRRSILGAMLVAGLALAPAAHASVIGSGEINVQYGTSTAYTGGGAADSTLTPASPETWNPLTTSALTVAGTGGTSDGLEDSAGNFTGIGLTVDTGGSSLHSYANSNTAGTNNGPPNPAFMAHYFFYSGFTTTLTNVPAGNYTLYLYGAGNNTGQGAGFTIDPANIPAALGLTAEQAATTGDAADITLTPNGDGAGTKDSLNYVILPVTVADSGNGTGTLSWSTNRPQDYNYGGESNGFQLVAPAAAPEPASLGLLGAAALLAFSRKRRR